MSHPVVLIGSYPPPYGGCSVHIERLHRALSRDFRTIVVDFYGRPGSEADEQVLRFGPIGLAGGFRALAAIRRLRPAIAHFHVSALDEFLIAGQPLVATLPRVTAAVITIHSGSFAKKFTRASPWRVWALRLLLARFAKIVVVSDEPRRGLENLGISPRKIAVIAAFLPPIVDETDRVRNVLASIGPHSRLVISSGCGLPYYGFETILDAVSRVASPSASIGVILCTYQTFDDEHMARLARHRAPGVETIVVRDLSAAEFGWLLERCDTYVRATDRDGDAVALREAAYFGKTTIASDCVTRPVEAMLFRTGDAASLAEALRRTRSSAANSQAPDGRRELAALRNVYESVIRSDRSRAISTPVRR